MSRISVIFMTLKEYMDKHKESYCNGELWDYPLSELDHIMRNTDIERVALINDRLYELP